MSWASWQRRFSSASVHDEDLLSTPKVRIRTYSDSIAIKATPEEKDLAVQPAPLGMVQRRSSNASSSGGSVGSGGGGGGGRHVTNFLASQTLGLCFLAVPPSTAIKHDSDHLNPNPPEEDAEFEDHRSSSRLWLRRSSDLTHLAPAPKPERRLSERLSGAKLSLAMAASAARKSKGFSQLLSTNNKARSVFSSTSKLDETPAKGSLLETSPIVTPPSPPPSGRKKPSSAAADDGESRNYQLKKFSHSTPALPQLHYDLTLAKSKSRQKKFLRLFPKINQDECLLDHYTCALVGDLLLQGHLYITYNYFAFHSNVFGYVTKLLIPMGSVRKITKEKTAKIIPNAIGVTTNEGKKIFGSLMARDVVYRLAVSVWKKYHFPGGGSFSSGEKEYEGSSQNGEQSSNESHSQHSADGLIASLPSRPGGESSVHPTSATEGCTSSDMEENDSAIERSCSPTPDREEEVVDGAKEPTGLLSNLKLMGGSKSGSILFKFWSSRNSLNKDDDAASGAQTAEDEPYEKDYDPQLDAARTKGEASTEAIHSWPLKSISLLLVILCLSAGFLWYRVYLLHSSLESRLQSELDPGRQVVKSIYSPQMQELVDSLHLLLSSRSSAGGEERHE